MNLFGLISKNQRLDVRGGVLPEQSNGLPDTTTPNGICARCNTQSSFNALMTLPVTFDGGIVSQYPAKDIPTHVDQVSVLQCRHCQQCVVVIEEKMIGGVSVRKPTVGNKTSGLITYRGIHWWPLPNVSVSSDVPNEIANAFNEATICLYAGAPRAAAAMARRTLESICIDKGVTSGVLFERINELGARGVLLPTLRDWAHEVRLIGNNGAHFDLIDQVTQEDAKDLIRFVRELTKYLYELPADLARRRRNE